MSVLCSVKFIALVNFQKHQSNQTVFFLSLKRCACYLLFLSSVETHSTYYVSKN